MLLLIQGSSACPCCLRSFSKSFVLLSVSTVIALVPSKSKSPGVSYFVKAMRCLSKADATSSSGTFSTFPETELPFFKQSKELTTKNFIIELIFCSIKLETLRENYIEFTTIPYFQNTRYEEVSLDDPLVMPRPLWRFV